MRIKQIDIIYIDNDIAIFLSMLIKSSHYKEYTWRKSKLLEY